MARLSFQALARRRTGSRTAEREVLGRITKIESTLRTLERHLASRETPWPINDEEYLSLEKTVKSQHKRTMLSRGRLWMLWQAVHNVAPLEGGAAEIGTYRGGSAYFLAAAFAAAGQDVPLEVIDTFEGHPQRKLSAHDHAEHKSPGQFTDTSYESVAAYLAEFENVTVHKGEFSDVAARLPERPYRLVHVDVDLYEPTRDCLTYFGPRLVAGGIIVLDDYDSVTCPGIRRAAEEYLAADAAFQAWNPRTKQLLLTKSLTTGSS